MVTFSVFMVCDVVVFMELLNSYIFKGTLEIITLNEYVLKFDQLREQLEEEMRVHSYWVKFLLLQ